LKHLFPSFGSALIASFYLRAHLHIDKFGNVQLCLGNANSGSCADAFRVEDLKLTLYLLRVEHRHNTDSRRFFLDEYWLFKRWLWRFLIIIHSFLYFLVDPFRSLHRAYRMSLPPQPGSHLLDQNSSLQSLQDVNSFKPESDDGFGSRPSFTKSKW